MSDAGPHDILLAEDNTSDIELTLRALKAEQLTAAVAVVRDGEEALDYLFRRGAFAGRSDPQPRLILLDLKLPRLDGLAVLRAVKQNEATRPIPVVVLTSSMERGDLTASYRLGVNSYVQKPLDFHQFRGLMRRIGEYWLGVNQPPPEEALRSEGGPS